LAGANGRSYFGIDLAASIMAPATPCGFWTTKKQLTVERTMG
jgi:hypothetical protein